MSKVDDAQKVITSVEMLEAELTRASEHLIPKLREYLQAVRAVRMAFGEEVKHVISYSSQFQGMAKHAEDLATLGDNLERLKKILTPEFLEVIERLTKK